MRHAVSEGSIEYAWRLNGRWNSLGAARLSPPAIPARGSEEEFITEHYWGYALQRDGSALEYQVEHPQWAVWSASGALFAGDCAALYGPEFGPFFTGPPLSAFVAVGSPVTVRKGALVPGI
jgi:hypothetical protein